jgi:hypothetical protein
MKRLALLLAASFSAGSAAAHTCIGEPRQHRLRANHPPGARLDRLAADPEKSCKGGLCLGQVNLGFGRIVVSEIEVPILLANLV